MVELTQPIWIPKQPLIHIFFDVDSTLSSIEGIDILAKWNQVGSEVSAITDQCMSKTGMTPEAYEQRLNMVKPTIEQINQLSELYVNQLTAGALEVITILRRLNKNIYIVSAGIRQALLSLANHLSIPMKRIYAVDVFFDDKGHYHHFDKTSPLACKDGKTQVIKKACPITKTALLVGDGLSDLEASTVVKRFIGFGGHCVRKTIEKASDFYITAPHLYALLPLVLTTEELAGLTQNEYRHYWKGMTAIRNNQVNIKESGNVQN